MSAIEQSTRRHEPGRPTGVAARRSARVRIAALWMLLVLLATAAAYIFWGRDRLPVDEVLQVLRFRQLRFHGAGLDAGGVYGTSLTLRDG